MSILVQIINITEGRDLTNGFVPMEVIGNLVINETEGVIKICSHHGFGIHIKPGEKISLEFLE